MTILTKTSPAPDTIATPGPAWLWRGRVPCLDGLRALSILLVLLAHGAKTHGFAAPRLLREFARHVTPCVDVFFVISGFLITLLLTREITRNGSIRLKEFYVRRVLRTLPVYLVFLLTVFALTHGDFIHLETRDWVGALTYTVNFLRDPSWEIGHTWFLSIQEQFYLLWPPLILIVGLRGARVAAIAFLCAAPVLRVLVWAVAREQLPMVDHWTFTGCDSIAAGCLLALLAADPVWAGRLTTWSTRALPSDRPGSREPRDENRRTLAVGMTALVVLLLSEALSFVTIYTIAVGYTVKAICIAILVWICVNQGEGLLGRILNTRPLVAIGAVSFSLYIWQQIFLNPHNTTWVCRWPANLILAGVAAVISYYAIELPFLRLKDHGARPKVKPVLSGDDEAGTKERSPHGDNLCVNAGA